MASLFQVLILAQVYLFSRGQTSLNCGLRSRCDLLGFTVPSMIDALSDDGNAEVQFVCTVPQNPRGELLSVTWWFDSSGFFTGDEVEIFPSDVMEEAMFYLPSPNILVIREVGRQFEGVFQCLLMESEAPQPTRLSLGCLFVLGQGVFTSCPDSNVGCFDETILVPRGGTAELDVRLMFRDGGSCVNQGVSVLRVFKDPLPDILLYVCSDLTSFRGTPCEDRDRFTVVDAMNCTVDCKYNIILRLSDFNESDEGVYNVEVNFLSIGDTVRRSLARRFRFMLSDEEPSQTTTGSEGMVGESTQNIGGIIGGVVGVIGFVVLLAAAAVIIALYWYHKVRDPRKPSKDLLNMTKREQKEFLNNHADSTVSMKTDFNERREKGSSVIAESCDLSGDKFSVPAFV